MKLPEMQIANQRKSLKRSVKSVNFTDQSLLDFASQRTDSLHGGNFSSYITALIERDQSMNWNFDSPHDFEDQILGIIKPYGGRPSMFTDVSGFEIPKINTVIEVRCRFPREKQMEYQLLNRLYRIAMSRFHSRSTSIILVYPQTLAGSEKEKFRQIGAAGFQGLIVCDPVEMEEYIKSRLEPTT